MPAVEADEDERPEGQVTEADYDYVLTGVHVLLGEENEYLDVADTTDLCTEETRWRSLAEQLADVYQPCATSWPCIRMQPRNRWRPHWLSCRRISATIGANSWSTPCVSCIASNKK